MRDHYDGPFTLTEKDIMYGGKISQTLGEASSEILISA